ncbi:MAG: hypothetical protein ACYC26_10510 [Phycisphaerales bacterium]
MTTLWIALPAFFGYFVACHTYGCWLNKKLFKLDADATVGWKNRCRRWKRKRICDFGFVISMCYIDRDS